MSKSIPLVCTAISLCSLIFGLIPNDFQIHFEYDRNNVIKGQIWRLWTGHLVHYSLQQAIIDLSILMLTGSVVEKTLAARYTALLFILSMPTISIGLLTLFPEIVHYRGASSISVMFAVMACIILWKSETRWRPILVALVLAEVIKTIFDANGYSFSLTHLPEGIHVAWQAHVLGALLGLLSMPLFFWHIRKAKREL
jgi:rhomboid family GlyGly-CTERM serine protease